METRPDPSKDTPRNAGVHWRTRMYWKAAFLWLIFTTPALLFGGDPPVPVAGGNETPGPLIGTWESETRSQGGIGETLEFLADGQVLTTPTVMVDSKYRMEEDRLIMMISDKPGELREVPMRFTIRGDRMSRGTGANITRLRRLTASAEIPVVGAWTHRHPAGEDVVETYYPDGRHEFRLRIGRPVAGKYIVTARSCAKRKLELET